MESDRVKKPGEDLITWKTMDSEERKSEELVKFANRNYKVEVKSGLDLVKFLMKNEHNPQLKQRLAELGHTLNGILLNRAAKRYE